MGNHAARSAGQGRLRGWNAGNCCTHGVGIATLFQARRDVRIVAAHEENPRRAKELAETLGFPLAQKSYEAVIHHPEVDFVAITCSPCDKAGSVEQLLAAMRQGTPPSSNVESMVNATEVLMAAYASILELRAISLPLASGENRLAKHRRR